MGDMSPNVSAVATPMNWTHEAFLPGGARHPVKRCDVLQGPLFLELNPDQTLHALALTALFAKRGGFSLLGAAMECGTLINIHYNG